MDLKKIEFSLKKIGYITQIHESINSLTIALPDKDGNPIFGTTSRIEIEQNTIKYNFYSGQVPITEIFNDEKFLINYIKEKFPLN